jgi:hypothetical protein
MAKADNHGNAVADADQAPKTTHDMSTASNMATANSARKEFDGSNPPEGFTAAEQTGRRDTHTAARETEANQARGASSDQTTIANAADDSLYTRPFDNGYHFPPKYNWKESTWQGLVAFWRYFITPLGFLVVVYGLNVVAWGGMLFLLLCNAAPAMCVPTCDDIDSPRRIWIEWDSQIVNALFCVTGFGLAPWRFRDLYYLLQYRVWKKQDALRRLGGIHRGWFRLPGSQDLSIDVGPNTIPGSTTPLAVPYPEEKTPEPPLTGVRAPATPIWKMDFVIWTMVWNTFLQGVLSGIMWGLNRYNRPSWATGLFVALACIVAACGGIMMFMEGKKVKKVEGVALTEQDLERLARDKELGIPHYNNISDKKPKDKVNKKSKTPSKDEKKR